MFLPGDEHNRKSVTVTTTAPTADELRLEDLKTYTHRHEIFVASAAVPSGSGQTASHSTIAITLHRRGIDDTLPPSSLLEPLTTLTVSLPAGELGPALSGVQGYAGLGKIGLSDGDVQLWTLSVYSEHADADHIFRDNRRPVWKWVKRAGPYGPLRGVWETELSQALEDGQWRGGRDLLLLVAGVSEATRRSLVGRRLSSLQALTSEMG